MPENGTPTLTGWKKRISAYCLEHTISRSAGQIERLALKIHKRAVSYQDVDLARVIQYSDPTGETAVNNIERKAA